MRKLAIILGLALLIAIRADAQGSQYSGTTYAAGVPVAGATVSVCTTTATIGTGSTPCSPTVTIYSNAALTTTIPNPLTSDGNGNFTFFLAHGYYTIQAYGTATLSFGPIHVGSGGFGSSGGGATGTAGVTSIFTPPRTGAVVANVGDYIFSQIGGTAAESQLPATTLFSDQNFTAGAKNFDFSFATSFKLPPGLLPANFPGGPRTVLSSYNALTGTFSGATQGQCTDAQAGGSYRIGTSGVGASDFGCLMIASSPGLQSWTLPDAGSPGFGQNWDGYVTVPPNGGILTICRDVASLFLNQNNQTCITILPSQRALITSPDNANWNAYYDGNGTFTAANAAADIGATTITTPISNSSYWVTATVVCRTAVNGTETVTISYTDTNSIAQTITATTGTCNGGTPTVGTLSANIRAKASTNIQYSTTHATTQPSYDLTVTLQQTGAQ